jgi:fructose PTS system EIIA component
MPGIESPKPKAADVNIWNRLSNSLIILDLKNSDRDAAIIELSGCLKKSEGVIDYDKFLQDVFKRENDITTGIGNNIAIPHARTKMVKDFVIAIGRSNAGVDFHSVDGKPVNIIILMGAPLDKISSYLKILSHLSHLLKRPGFVDGLKNATDPESIINHFHKYEN